MMKTAVTHGLIRNDKGVALLHIIMVLLFVAVVAGAAALLTGPLSKRSKTVETRKTIDSIVQAVMGYAGSNHRLPRTNEFTAVAKASNDPWGNPYSYITDDDLVTIPAGSGDAICRRRTTRLTVRQCSDAGCGVYADVANVAFIVLSPGANFNNQTAGTQAVTAATRVNVYSGGLAVDNYPGDLGGARVEAYDDVTRWVTLDELKQKTGCYGAAQGRMRILNNELPTVCIGSSYNATLYSDGGVSPYGVWSLSPALPAGLSMNAATGVISGTTSATAGSYPVTFSRSDADGTTVSRLLALSVKNCASGSSAYWTFNDPANLGGTTSGGVTSVGGAWGSALYFSGISSFTPSGQGATNEKFSFRSDQPFSIVLWAKLMKDPATAPSSLVYPFVSKAGPAPQYNGYYLELLSRNNSPPPGVSYHRVVFRLASDETVPAMVHVYSRVPIVYDPAGIWYHIAASYNGNGLASGVRLYVAGTLNDRTVSDNLAGGSIVNTQPLKVGDYGKGYFNSVVLDEVQVYNRTIQQLSVAVTLRSGATGVVQSSPVTGSPEKIDCPTKCEAYYVTGSTVTVTAYPGPGSTFRQWRAPGACAGATTPACTVTLGTDETADAEFR